MKPSFLSKAPQFYYCAFHRLHAVTQKSDASNINNLCFIQIYTGEERLQWGVLLLFIQVCLNSLRELVPALARTVNTC